MIEFYLVTAILIGICLNHANGWVRALGRIVAGLALSLVASSILLANLDGTFAAVSGVKPWLLNAQGLLHLLGAGLLFWSVPAALRRAEGAAIPLFGSRDAYGQASRLLHWMGGGLMISVFAMGQFVVVLGEGTPERAGFLDVHMALGAALFLIFALRMALRLATPAPRVPPPAMLGHGLLYALVMAICLTGFAMASAPTLLFGLRFPNLPPSSLAEALHRVWLPALLALLFLAHLGGAVHSIRRMAR